MSPDLREAAIEAIDREAMYAQKRGEIADAVLAVVRERLLSNATAGAVAAAQRLRNADARALLSAAWDVLEGGEL